MTPKTILTVDPGASNGGLAYYRQGEPVKAVKMPRELSELDPFIKYVKEIDSETVVFIEKVQMFSSDSDKEKNPGKEYRIKVLLANYEQIKALVIYNGLKYIEVYPQSWQATLGLNKCKNLSDKDRKNKFKNYAANCFPEVKVTLWNSDALCILQFAFRKYESSPEWIKERLKNENTGFF